MEEMQILRQNLEDLNNSIRGRDISQIGIIELRRLKGEYEALHQLNLELQDRLRYDRSVSIADLRKALNLGDELWEGVRVALSPIQSTLKSKVALVFEKRREINRLRDERTRNHQVMENLRSQLEMTRNIMTRLTDPVALESYEGMIATFNTNIEQLELLDGSYEDQITKLIGEETVLRLGGTFTDLSEIEELSSGITEEESLKLEREARAEREEAPVELDTHRLTEPEVPLIGGEDLTAGLDTDLHEDDVEHEDDVKDVPILTESEEEAEKDVPVLTEGEESERKIPVLFEGEGAPEDEAEREMPVLPEDEGTPEDEEEKEREIPGLPEGEETPGDDEEKEREMPLLFGEEAPERGMPVLEEDSEREMPVLEEDAGREMPVLTEDETKPDRAMPILEEDPDDEVVHKAEVKAPKTSLWTKLQPILEAVKIFLLTAVAVHTGLLAGGAKAPKTNNVPETVEETETPELDTPELDTPEYTTSEVTKAPETPAPTEAPTEKPAELVPFVEETTVEPTEEPPAEKTEELPIKLGPNEAAFDTRTGIEVNANGNAYDLYGGTPQEKRNLEKNEDGTSTVTEKDLKKDKPKEEKPTAEQKKEPERTGEEVSEEEARKKMSTQEEANLDDAINNTNWDEWFDNIPTRNQ